MAARAASLTSSGAGKSGNPCARLTASYCKAKRVISQMTDSVKYSAFSESTDRAVLAILSAVGLASAELVIIGFREVKGFMDEHQPAKRVKRVNRTRGSRERVSRTTAWCSKLGPEWRGRGDKFAGKAQHCGPRSGHIRGSA